MKITKSELKQIIKEEITKALMSEGMTPEDKKFLKDNDFDDPPSGLTPEQEKAYVDALKERPEDYEEIYDRFEDRADDNRYNLEYHTYDDLDED